MGFGIKLIDGISQANNQVFKMLAGKDVDLTEADDFGGNLADADLILVDDVSVDSGGGTQASTKKSAMSRVWTYILGKINSTLTGAVEVAADGATTISNNAVDTQHIADDAIEEEHIGAGEVKTAAIGNEQVTYAKIQNVSATDKILGRDSAGAGAIEEISPGSLRTMINVADGSNAYVHPNHSGEVTSTADGATVIVDDIVDEANLKVSNTPTNGYFLSAQSSAAGGLTWAEASGGDTDLTATANGTSLTVNSSTGDNVALPAADTNNWGVMTDEMFDAVVANTSKSTNVSTNLGISGTTGARTITSSDGTDAVIPIATTSVSGVMSKAIFDEHTLNNNKATNVAGDLTATATVNSFTIETTNGENVSLPVAVASSGNEGRLGLITGSQAAQIAANSTISTQFAQLIGNIPTNTQVLWIDQVGDIDVGSEASDENDHLMTALAIKNRIEDYSYSTTTGTVDTSGTPVANDFARFTDADTIEGRSYTEVKDDLTLGNVENKSSATIRGEIVSADIPNNAADTTGTAEQANLASLSDESTDQTCFITFASDATGFERLKTGSNLTFDSSTGTLTANYIIGKTNTFTFTQSSVSDTWIITHNLDKFPNVTVVDSGGSVVRGTIVYNSLNKLTITFFAGGIGLAFSGKAYLN